MSRRTSVLMAAAVGVLGGAVVGGSALVGATAQSGSAQSGSGQSGSGQSTSGSGAGASSIVDVSAEGLPCGALRKLLPEELKADLKSVRDLPAGEERLAAIRRIAQDARLGEYGTTVEKLAEKRLDHRKERWQRLPADLQADLRELRTTPADERKAAVEKIRKSALDGEYGAKVQQFAERLQEHREACRP